MPAMNNSSNLDEIERFALQLAREAGQIVEQERSRNDFDRNYKSHSELVTSADVKVDDFINGRLKEKFPDHRVLSEEGMSSLQALNDYTAPLWVVDPIDGTVNFAYGHPQVAVSIAYFENGQAQVGVVHAPFQQETFHARRHSGAWLNDQPIQCSRTGQFREALVATGFPYHKDTVQSLVRRLESVLSHCRDIRRIGSAAMDICWVANGRLDAYYETVSPWDFAAAVLIAREAGAQCGHLNPAPENIPAELYGQDIIVAPPALYPTLKQLLRDADDGAA